MTTTLDTPLDGTHTPVEKYVYSSDILQRLASYCGLYTTSTMHNTGRRYDVGSMVEQLQQQQMLTHTGSPSTYSSSMVYVLEPPIASYAPTVEGGLLQIFFIVDPLSLAGQRASALIRLFHQELQYVQTIVFTPRMDITDFPLQNFYRYVLPSSSSSSSSSSSGAVVSSIARFTHLPEQHTLTVRVDIPEPWNVQALLASQDIDNLRCSPSSCGERMMIVMMMMMMIVTEEHHLTIYHLLPPSLLMCCDRLVYYVEYIS